jgi:hypothetical protein
LLREVKEKRHKRAKLKEQFQYQLIHDLIKKGVIF